MDVTSAGRASTGVALLTGLGLLAGCGAGTAAAPSISVQAGGDAITVHPTQYCLAGKGERYQGRAPIIEVTPDTTITLTVPDAVAATGWGVQVFDKDLAEMIGEVAVPDGVATYNKISTSDVVPPTFYLVIVEHSRPKECSGLSGAWPVGFIRTGGTAATTSPSESPAG
jgi:hypothetical protein